MNIWEEYFQQIQDVCPWSWSAWQKGKIDIVVWQGSVTHLDAYDARVYVHKSGSPRLLNKWHNKLNNLYPDYEFLWSHPRYKHKSAPLPCLIQQDRAFLKRLRDNLHK